MRDMILEEDFPLSDAFTRPKIPEFSLLFGVDFLLVLVFLAIGLFLLLDCFLYPA